MTKLCIWLAGLALIAGLCAASFFAGGAQARAGLAKQHAQQLKQAIQNERAAASKEAFRALELNNAIVTEIEQRAERAAETQNQALKRLRAQLKKEKTDATCKPAVDFRFDVGTVRLFDSARLDVPAPAEPAAGSDEASAATSDVGIEALVANDAVIVRMYHDLANRHNSLVDYVERRMKEQTK